MSTNEEPRFIDLSHPLRSGMDVAPGLPRPRFEPFLTREASRSTYSGQAEFEITRLFLVGNTGTSLDSPFHRHRDGLDMADLPLERVVGLAGTCLDQSDWRGSGRRALAARLPEGSLSGRALLIRTGWDGQWGMQDYWLRGPFLEPELAEELVAAGVVLVGVDFSNVDDRSDPARPAHTRLLGAGVPIIENMRGLDQVAGRAFRLWAAPLAIEAAAALPVRVIAELEPHSDASS